MKRLQRILLFLFRALTAFSAKAQKQVFELYEDMDGVTTINISQRMLRSMGGVKIGKQKLGAMAKQLSSLQILTCDKPKLAATIRTTAEGYYKAKHYNIVLRNNDNGSTTIIYQRTLANKQSEFVLLSADAHSINLINVIGTITLQQLQDYY